jgi:hypothetical protein
MSFRCCVTVDGTAGPEHIAPDRQSICNFLQSNQGCLSMSKQGDNKAVVGRWFTEFWGKTVSLGVIDEIVAPTCRSSIRCMRPAAATPTLGRL